MKMTALKLIEKTWLILAIITFFLGVYKSATVGFLEGNTYWLFICTFMAGFMYSFKRKQRLKYAKQKEEETQN